MTQTLDDPRQSLLSMTTPPPPSHAALSWWFVFLRQAGVLLRNLCTTHTHLYHMRRAQFRAARLSIILTLAVELDSCAGWCRNPMLWVLLLASPLSSRQMNAKFSMVYNHLLRSGLVAIGCWTRKVPRKAKLRGAQLQDASDPRHHRSHHHHHHRRHRHRRDHHRHRVPATPLLPSGL